MPFRKRDKPLVYAVAGWSGYFVMALELLAGRLLAPYFGTGIYVWGGVITLFMIALALGYLLGGRLSVAQPRVRVLGALLLVAAAAALPIVAFGDDTLKAIFEHISDPRYGSLAACGALFFLPTLLSGTVPPYAIRLLVSDTQRTGLSAGWLWFVSTFGSAAGTIVTSFYLVLLLELNQIILLMLAVSTVLGIVCLIAGDRRS